MMDKFSLHGANHHCRTDAFRPPQSRGDRRSKIARESGNSKGVAVAVIAAHPSYGSNEQQMLKKLMSR